MLRQGACEVHDKINNSLSCHQWYVCDKMITTAPYHHGIPVSICLDQSSWVSGNLGRFLYGDCKHVMITCAGVCFVLLTSRAMLSMDQRKVFFFYRNKDMGIQS